MQKWIARILFFMIFALVFLSVGQSVAAQFDGTCKFGVHMLSPSDEDYVKAAELINSNGGANCWVTVVFREDEMKAEDLQRIHDLARRHNFNIIHRLEKGFDDRGNWYMPTRETVELFIEEIETINPYSKDVYVTLGNEPTHSAMCGGCTPEEYAAWAAEAIDMLHTASRDDDITYQVGLAGQDLASPQQPANGLYDAGIFMERMFSAQPDLLCEVDMWVSHSYPRSFVGSGTAAGRLSPQGYAWELQFAERQARDDCKEHVRNLPVMITETGYRTGPSGVSQADALVQTQRMLDIYAADPRVRAVTFFAYRFCDEPFEAFALAGCDVSSLNGVGQALQQYRKGTGDVRHLHKARTKATCPEELVENMEFECEIVATNRGTDIWKDIGGEYGLRLLGVNVTEEEGSPSFSISRFRDIEPGKDLTVTLRYNPGNVIGEHDITLGLMRKGRLVLGLANWKVPVYESPTFKAHVENIFGRNITTTNAQLQVFDKEDNVVFKSSVDISNGMLESGKISGVVFGECYRPVLIVPGNLPVQKQCLVFEKGENFIEMPRLLPVDTNKDGTLTFSDIIERYSN